MAPEMNETVLCGPSEIANAVERICLTAPLPVDVHTHLYSARFGDLLLWGFDELVTYHYLIAEVARTNRAVSPDQFFAMSKTEQADHIWQSLFIDESPISEARRGVLTCLKSYGLDVEGRNVEEYREFFAATTMEEHIDRVFEVANCERVIMKNDPFDDAERPIWDQGPEDDERFLAALRIDPLLVTWHDAQPRLAEWGYDVALDLSGSTLSEEALPDGLGRADEPALHGGVARVQLPVPGRRPHEHRDHRRGDRARVHGAGHPVLADDRRKAPGEPVAAAGG